MLETRPSAAKKILTLRWALVGRSTGQSDRVPSPTGETPVIRQKMGAALSVTHQNVTRQDPKLLDFHRKPSERKPTEHNLRVVILLVHASQMILQERNK